MRFVTAFCLLLLAVTASATQSVTLAWCPSADTNVVGYFVLYGVKGTCTTNSGAQYSGCGGTLISTNTVVCGNYTNKVNVGNVTNATISGLVVKTTYYFSVTAYNVLMLESVPSNECSYSVPTDLSLLTPTDLRIRKP